MNWRGGGGPAERVQAGGRRGGGNRGRGRWMETAAADRAQWATNGSERHGQGARQTGASRPNRRPRLSITDIMPVPDCRPQVPQSATMGSH